MFTGLIEEIGTIDHTAPEGDGVRFTITARNVMDDLAVDHSISVNGVCLTVTQRSATSFDVTAVAETLRKTTTGHLAKGDMVNLERAVRLNDRLGGHLVQGHVDATGIVDDIIVNETGREIWVRFPAAYRKWLIPVGSICIDGISLTVAALEDERCKVAIIPHTLTHTTIGERRIGDVVNLEFDMIAKYIDNLTNHA